MLLFRGVRNGRIKTYTDHEHQCNDCKDFDLKVKVFKDYYHFFFLPAFPTGVKTVKIRCNKCGEPYRSDSLQKQYELRTRNPFWLYSWIILVGLLVLGAVVAVQVNDRLNHSYVSSPRPGDVYAVSPRHSLDVFFKVVRVNGDSVMTYGNHYQYLSSTNTLDTADYFSLDRPTLFSKKDLVGMLDSGVITNVSRNYDESSGFNRVK